MIQKPSVEEMKHDSIRELSLEEVEQVDGALAPLAWGAVILGVKLCAIAITLYQMS